MKIDSNKISIMLVTSDYRGDHSADVQIAINVIPGETIEELINRLNLDVLDKIEIRVIKEVSP